MTNTMLIIDDDFLDEGSIMELDRMFLRETAPWTYTNRLINPDHPFNVDNINYYNGVQFNHVLFIMCREQSELYEPLMQALYRFCDKNNIEIYGISRAKANITFPDNTVTDVENSQTPHVDHNFEHLVFLYYINDADGDTIVYNEKFVNNDGIALTELARVTPKAGRAIVFDGLQYHSPMLPTKGYRAVINITFLGRKRDN